MSLTGCSGRERQCVGERKIKTRVAQLFFTYSLHIVVEKDNVW